MKERLLQSIRAIRVLNLLMIALTMFLARHFLVLQVLENDFRIGSTLAGWQFAILVAATLYIAAAGYLLNDHFDKDIDRINRPGKKSITGWSERTTAITCLLLDLAGIGLGYLVGYWSGNKHLGLLFVLSALILLAYSRFLKKLPLLGNIAVALLAALVVLLPGLAEGGLLHSTDAVYHQAATYIWRGLTGYALFAFVSTFIREVIKDTEDIVGDKRARRKTVPIMAGEKATRFIILILLLLMVRGLVFVQQRFIIDGYFVLPAYIAIAIEIPAFAGMFMVYNADSNKDYGRLSLLMKFIILAGILSMVLYKVIL